ncbi:MAG: K(+)-transporting ATPase subunit F [Planctomycetes bacterium]|nr:K(+)-transporting ATPase subunit F [Planctomycetota bacterium]
MTSGIPEIVALLIAAGLFAYLTVALLKPEWFS